MSRATQVAVVGGGIGGLVAAGLLARAGNRVVLYEQEPCLGGKAQQFRERGTVLDTGPTLLTLPGLVRETFAALGAEDLLPRFVTLSPQCEYRWDDGSSFAVHPELEATRASVEAMAPGEGRGVEGFYAAAAAIHRAAGEPYLEAPFEGVARFLGRVVRRGPSALLRGVQMSTLHALATRHFRDPRLQQFVGRFATYTGASPYQASAAFALIPHLERVEGVHHVEGGTGALVAALEAAARRLGVEIRLGTRGAWKQAGASWRAGPAGEEAPVDAVVVNADPLGASGLSKAPLAMSGYVLLLNVPVRSRLPHHTVFFSCDYRREFEEIFSGRVPSEPTVYVCHPAASDASMAAPGTSGVFVMANVPAMGEAFLPHVERLRARCVTVVEALDPSVRGRLRILGERTPADFQRQGAPGGSLYGFLPHGRFGPFRRPRSHAAPGLVYAGGGTHPGGGVPMVMLSGRFAAMQVTADLEARA
ncbi:MAG TPA: phytoene desaturase family protein [Myxococcaceae bacterium]|nr:phytoene desaturase family protein [Myxococcaceae bacterium]